LFDKFTGKSKGEIYICQEKNLFRGATFFSRKIVGSPRAAQGIGAEIPQGRHWADRGIGADSPAPPPRSGGGDAPISFFNFLPFTCINTLFPVNYPQIGNFAFPF
jgi:hypothetical protein